MPRQVRKIFLSSSFIDLKGYREAAVHACHRVGLIPVYMEDFPPDPQDAVTVCLTKIDASDLFLGLYAHRYGYVPEGSEISITEIEYNQAFQKGLPLYLFEVDPDYPWLPAQIDKGKSFERLEHFKARIRQQHLIRKFRDVVTFREDALLYFHELAEQGSQSSTTDGRIPERRTLPVPPKMHSVPPYVGKTRFIGRNHELGELDAWVNSADPMLVVEAIGGVGKSALTWNWVQERANRALAKLAGTLWWSFYEGSASTDSFVREALAYITQADPEKIGSMPTDEQAQRLLAELRERPYLLVLDGFERLIDANHQLNSSELLDEQLQPDQHSHLDIQTEKLLLQLATCSPSKVLVTTRLMPSTLLNQAHQTIPGVRRLTLTGLNPEDGEELLYSLGVRGASDAVRRFLIQFDNHSLLIGALAGRILDYRLAPGDFNCWLTDPNEGGGLRLSTLNLTNRRKHILAYALEGLTPKRRQLLRQVAAFNDAVDYTFLSSINPNLPPRPNYLGQRDLQVYFRSPRYKDALTAFDNDLSDLESRGLLEWDRSNNKYNMHPIVRGYVLDELRGRVNTYENVRDHFVSVPRSSKQRLGPQLLRAASNSYFFDQVHVLFGGTGAVGGATALQMISFFEEAARHRPPGDRSPRIIITGRSKGEVRQFTHVLFDIQMRDHGRHPERIDSVGYRTVGGVTVELTVLPVDPSVPGLENFAQSDEAGRREAIRAFLERRGLHSDSPAGDKARALEDALRSQVARPFSDFLESYLAKRGLPPGTSRFRSVVVGIPLASLAAYKLADLDDAGPFLGVERGSARMDDLKEIYLQAIRDDLAYARDRLADEVLVAHTTAVGGMYDQEADGSRVIRLGFAHSALDDKLRKKQIFAEELARLYSEKRIKMLISAAAIGVDAVLVRESPPINGAIRRQLFKAEADGHKVIRPAVPPRMAVYPPVDLDLLGEEHEPVAFEHGRPLVVDYVLKSGENGFFTISNADALYRVMRVTTGGELGLILARTAIFGDDPHLPSFPGNACYYTETDNSRQVFDLLGQPKLRSSQLSGLQPKALQDLGSAKHQAELHTLGLLILLHRLKTLDLDSIPPHVDLAAFQPEEYFEAHSRLLTLEHVLTWQAGPLAEELRELVTAREERDLAPLKHFYQDDPDRQEAAHRVLRAAIRAAWTVPSIGTPVVYEKDGRRRVVAGYYAASIDQVMTHRDRFSTHLRQRFERLGGGDEAAFERFVELHIANFGFADLRPIAVLVTAKMDEEDLTGKVQVFRDEAGFIEALKRVEPYSYFTSSGLIALLIRLRGLTRLAHEFEPRLGTANEFRVHIPHDDHGRPLLMPGVVEAFRMVSEGLEKNTGAERLDGRWGYYV